MEAPPTPALSGIEMVEDALLLLPPLLVFPPLLVLPLPLAVF